MATGFDPRTVDFSRSRPAAFLPAIVRERCRPGQKVLDLGCGGGRNAHYLAEAGLDVVGVDIAQAMLDLCRVRFERAGLSGTFLQGTFDQIPAADASFDVILCLNSLDHCTFETARRAVSEMGRVLKRTGAVVLSFDAGEVGAEDDPGDFQTLPDGTRLYTGGEHAGMLFRPYRDDEIRSLLSEVVIRAFERRPDGTRVVSWSIA